MTKKMPFSDPTPPKKIVLLWTPPESTTGREHRLNAYRVREKGQRKSKESSCLALKRWRFQIVG